MHREEAINTLLEQLEELVHEVDALEDEDLGEPDAVDAILELAGVAGFLVRSDNYDELLDTVNAWRDGEGADWLASAWADADFSEIEADLDEALEAGGEAVLDVLEDLDELVDGAIWSGQTRALLPLLEQAVARLEDHQGAFGELSEAAALVTAEPFVQKYRALYGHWWVVARG